MRHNPLNTIHAKEARTCAFLAIISWNGMPFVKKQEKCGRILKKKREMFGGKGILL